MNPEVKAQWLEALRSGKYKQGYGVLVREKDGGKTHCCLGVLCDISPVSELTTDEWGLLDYSGEIDNDALLSDAVSEWSGVDISAQGTLAGINDRGNGPLTPTEEDKNYRAVIAYIEENL